jgi:hypothetical protein
MSVITNPISNIPVNVKSHTLGWSKLWKEQLNASIDHKCTPNILNANTVYIDHGANFGGTLNLFGGATKEVYDRINRVASCKNIVSLDWDMPDYGAMLKKRIGAKTTYEGITNEWCDQLSLRLSTVTPLLQEKLNNEGVTLGDSHTIAFSGSGHSVFRNDGKTLHGALSNGLVSLLRGYKPTSAIYLCFGSIDIRHHLLRHDTNAVEKLINEYVKQGNALGLEFGVSVHYCYPVPIEYEGRRIPKTGYYKKTPFYGTQQERVELTKRFIGLLEDKANGMTIRPPTDWYTMDSQKYAETFMEFGGSFHIAPPYYNRNNWGASPLGA